MALIQRTRVIWTGFTGSPGYTNLYARFGGPGNEDPTLHAEDVATLFTALRERMPRPVNVAIDQEVGIFDDETGDLEEFLLLPVAPPIEGNGTLGPYSAPSGAAIEWRTGATVGNRRLVGRTFVVPLSQTSYDSDGTLTQAAHAALQLAANNYADESVSAPVVWSRPRPGRPGVSATINAARVRDSVAVLRSRRG